MIPKSLSASAALVFEGCEARYKAEYIDKTPDLSGKAGLLGSACHSALEFWVTTNQHIKPWPTVGDRRKAMQVVWESIYSDYFSDRKHYDEGLSLLTKWVDRTDWHDREVISCEVKETFDLPTSIGKIPFTYIWDRCDRLSDGSIEIVDYKTVIQPVSPDELKERIQPRAYALAAAIKFPEATSIWVTYDLLRYDSVSAKFTREDNKVTWNYLKRLAEKILDSDGEWYTVNPECRWCVRKSSCPAIHKHAVGGGILGIADTLENTVDRRAQMKYAADALYASINQLDEQILSMAEEAEVYEVNTDHTKMKLGASARRTVESERALRVLPEEVKIKYAKIGVGDLEKILKEEELTDNQRSQLKQAISKQYGAIKVNTKPRLDIEDD